MIIKLNIDNVDYTVTAIVPPPPPPPPISPTGLLLVPANLNPIVVKLDALAWSGVHDAGTSGTAAGVSAYPVTIGGRQARSFPSDFTNYGGIRYHCIYNNDDDTTSTHFVFAGNLWVDDVSHLAQMELDNNQVTADGKTYIFGVQCNSNDGTWDVTKQDTSCHWVSTTAKGTPAGWPVKTWMPFEIATHRDNAGNITYDAVLFNGVIQQIGVTLPSASKLGWDIGRELVNVQIGGDKTGGSIRVYGNNLRMAKW